jgi:hypothetical protein
MGVRFGSQYSTVQQNALPANANETILYITGPLVIATDNAVVSLGWFADMVAGTGSVIFEFIIRRGTTLTAPAVSAFAWWQFSVPGSAYLMAGNYVDSPGGGAVPYCLTVVQAGATGAGTLVDGCLLAYVL